jgi:hypothetical protein
MAFTQTQVDALRAAIATGALTVRNANGEFVTYRSLAEMRQTLSVMVAELTSPALRRAANTYPAFSRYPADDAAAEQPLSQP